MKIHKSQGGKRKYQDDDIPTFGDLINPTTEGQKCFSEKEIIEMQFRFRNNSSNKYVKKTYG